MQVVAEQVKQKLGELRFYIRGGDDMVFKMIDQAIGESLNTCELCGSKHNVRQTENSTKTLCGSCMDKFLNGNPWPDDIERQSHVLSKLFICPKCDGNASLVIGGGEDRLECEECDGQD